MHLINCWFSQVAIARENWRDVVSTELSAGNKNMLASTETAFDL
ncbi:hypothetical protein [Aliterella atlantica]|nr:hypothetical protein [Aliterella atlantica]